MMPDLPPPYLCKEGSFQLLIINSRCPNMGLFLELWYLMDFHGFWNRLNLVPTPLLLPT